MSSDPCGIHNCVRVTGHAGAHSAAPSARTLDWDTHQADRRHADETLLRLDFDTPYWADLND
jgi:hypothetical protein